MTYMYGWRRAGPPWCDHQPTRLLRIHEDGPHEVYQLDFVMPGSSPRCAISRKHTRHRPNFR
jgi:hypothetical protein